MNAYSYLTKRYGNRRDPFGDAVRTLYRNPQLNADTEDSRVYQYLYERLDARLAGFAEVLVSSYEYQKYPDTAVTAHLNYICNRKGE